MIDVDTLAPLVVAARSLLALVFLTAAVGKLRDLAAFQGAVYAYRLLPNDLIRPVTLLVPVAEVAIGLMLPSGSVPMTTGISATAMLFVFVTAMTINILRGRRDIDCGCFQGRPSQHLTWGAVCRTAALAMAAALCGLSVPVSLAAAMQGLTAGAILFLLFATATALPTFGRKRPRISL